MRDYCSNEFKDNYFDKNNEQYKNLLYKFELEETNNLELQSNYLIYDNENNSSNDISSKFYKYSDFEINLLSQLSISPNLSTTNLKSNENYKSCNNEHNPVDSLQLDEKESTLNSTNSNSNLVHLHESLYFSNNNSVSLSNLNNQTIINNINYNINKEISSITCCKTCKSNYNNSKELKDIAYISKISTKEYSNLSNYLCDLNFSSNTIKELEFIKTIKNLLYNKEYINKLYNVMESNIFNNMDKDKPWLVLDLDETLIHTFNLDDINNSKKSFRYLKKPKYKDVKNNLGIYIRPYLIQFLNWAINIFNICLFTASDKTYANSILEIIDIKKYFKLVLTREHCININNKYYIKDLSLFPNIENVIIVDNLCISFSKNLSNGIHIESFINDNNDEELKDLISYLENILLLSEFNYLVNNNNKLININKEIIEKENNYYTLKELNESCMLLNTKFNNI